MNFKQMILLEHVLDIINYEQDGFDLALVFKIDNILYTGNFLQKVKNGGSTKRLAFKSHPIKGYELKDHILLFKENDMDELIRDRFLRMAHVDEDKKKLKTLVDNPSILLSKLVEFVYTLTPDDYLDHNYHITNCIHKMSNIDSDDEMYFYYVEENIYPISLVTL
ncbi:hypothetical protein SAMN04488100_1012 [Alkalibacterium putridalgicola]|uniref:Uncharacterized protein n=1 Tax=Alkalibacterium putridalgicola TaxID=426703 RepID=A0A1H7PTC8_9LACT|nr:hypothetical protein [Alkalibacterium putridalgicola]GEK88163.1 hypothetical protein APU01nite_02020 [Alkalibacterium putridalgicola]SEL38708.1 hypothetical protein SAMN04488100_1012 [Alkalibacterium putridalgicola]